MWAFILGLAVALDLGDAHGHKQHRHRHHHARASLLTTGRRDPALHLEPSKPEPPRHLSRHLRNLLEHRKPEERAERRASVSARPEEKPAAPAAGKAAPELPIVRPAVEAAAAPAVETAVQPPPARPAEAVRADESQDPLGVADQAKEEEDDLDADLDEDEEPAATSAPSVPAAAPATTSKAELNGTSNASAVKASAQSTGKEALGSSVAPTLTSQEVRAAVEGDDAPLLDNAKRPTATVTPATAAPEAPAAPAAPAPAKTQATNFSVSMGGLDPDYAKEDLPFQRISAVLAKFPLLGASPLWNLVNPSALTSHDPPVINMRLADLRNLMTPDGQGLADAFPEMHLRDLPLFEWMPNKTLPKEWLNPVDAEMPEFVDFLPEAVGRTSLQDIRLRDLMAVAEQKRAVWSQHWQDAQKNLKSEDLEVEVEDFETRLKKATAERDDAMSQTQALESEHKALVAAMDLLQKKYNGDQDLIEHQEEEHREGDAVRAALGKKVEEMDQGRKELEQKIAMKSAQLATLKQQAATMKQAADSKQHEIDELLAGKKDAEKALRAAKSDLAKDANLATELKEVKTEDAQLKTELNATLSDEAAEAKANAALNAEVSTLVAENRRLATVHLATLD